MSLGRKIITSSSLLVGIKAFQRLIGLISILFLARLLTPDDFAIVALTSIVVHFFDILSNAGSEQYIIQKDRVTRADLNTAWSIDLSIKSALWLCLILSAPYAAAFFRQPALEPALYAASCILVINALKNPGLFLKKQHFEYRGIFWLSVVQRLSTFFVVIGIAFVERSYWALIIGDIFSSLVFTLGSYVIDRHRPGLSYAKWRQQWHFSGWLLIKSIVGYTRSQIDTLIVSRFFPAAQLGQYYLARDIVMMPSHNLIAPAIEPLLAAFRQYRDDTAALESRIRLSLFAVSLVSIPASVFLWCFPAPVIAVLLGAQWQDTPPLLSALSLLLLYYSFVLVFEQGLVAMRKVKTLFWYDLSSLLLITLGLLALMSSSIVELALLRGILGIVTMLALALYIKYLIGLDLLKLLRLIAPVAVAALAAAWLTARLPLLSTLPLLQLLQQLSVFFLAYMILCLLFLPIINRDTLSLSRIRQYLSRKGDTGSD